MGRLPPWANARLLAAVATAAVFVLAAVVAILLAGYATRADAAARTNFCADVPQAPEFTTAKDASVLPFPYGDVSSCRVLDTGTPIAGHPDFYGVLWLDTAKGPVLLRAEYTNTNDGRYYVATGIELGPDDARGLVADAQIQQLRAAIADRGGVRRQPWILHHGPDGG